jgi:6-pyruvoyl-tetrahydropterin synthase
MIKLKHILTEQREREGGKGLFDPNSDFNTIGVASANITMWAIGLGYAITGWALGLGELIGGRKEYNRINKKLTDDIVTAINEKLPAEKLNKIDEARWKQLKPVFQNIGKEYSREIKKSFSRKQLSRDDQNKINALVEQYANTIYDELANFLKSANTAEHLKITDAELAPFKVEAFPKIKDYVLLLTNRFKKLNTGTFNLNPDPLIDRYKDNE